MSHATTLQTQEGAALLFANMTARESLGSLFDYRIEAVSRNVQVDLRGLLGTPATVTVTTPQGFVRYFNGMVAEAEQGAFVNIDNVRYATYVLRVVPRAWLLTQASDCRIFKNVSVPDIVRQMLSEFGFTDVSVRLSAHYPPREYCVQYRESSFAFISRLMEQEGIYYYFTHADGVHTMVLADALGAHAAVSGFESLPYVPPLERGSRMTASIAEWTMARGIRPTRVKLDDYDYLRPRASLLNSEPPGDSVDGYTGASLEGFDFPYGGPGVSQRVEDGQRYAQVRIDAQNVAKAVSSGTTDAVGMTTGSLFRLADFPLSAVNDEYLVTATQIRLVEPDYQAGGNEADEGEPPFACSFQVIRGRQPYRSPQATPRPVIHGLQTALVHGPADEDIAVDKYGRVQVQFFWNTPSRPHADQSCPVRVASQWAGKRWGAIQIPRVGQEVVVSFLDGDPDRPLIIGSVYNQEHMPPYPLPDERTKSGMVSRSLMGGPGDANELRFEDKKGEEELYLHAQRDLRVEAERDHSVTIDRDEAGAIKRDRTHSVGRDDTLHVGRRLRIEAGEEIEFVTGLARITMNSSGQIQVAGSMLRNTATGTIQLTAGAATSITAGASVSMTAGAAVSLTAGAAVDVNAAGAVAVTAGAALTLTATLGPAVLTGKPPLLA